MTKFEENLIDKGYLMYIFNGKTMKYEKAKRYFLSTMSNLAHIYIHNTDKLLLDKIEQGKSVMDDDFTWDDRAKEIVFGLHEFKKPPTLIRPRPRIKVIRPSDEGDIAQVTYDEWDDNMNIVLQKIPFETIFKAMYDRRMLIKIDLIKGTEEIVTFDK